jgi:IS30 family transposase
MDDFKAELEKQMKKATASVQSSPKPVAEPKSQGALREEPVIAESKTEQELPTTGERRDRAAAGETVQVQKTLARRPASNANRVTVNLFEADRRALAVIKEVLSTAGHDFTSRSDSIKVALRLASKAKPEELTRLYQQVKAEDKRFRANE